MEVGTEIHEMIQSRLSLEHPGYRPEVPLSELIATDQYDLKIRGRCDGEFPGEVKLLEEIKSSFNLSSLKKSLENQPDHPYILQLIYT